ncbi:MAG: hypothetical protein JWM47_3385 [Acidimicrobiales bacterium]|nr:hypothetical protein [Acidimicrobiales bacterium]
MNLAALLAALDHPGARRRFTATPGGPPDGVDWVPWGAARPEAPVAGLGIGIPELTGSMAFHGLAAPVVDLATSLFVTSGVTVELDAEGLWVRSEGPSVTEVAVDGGRPVREVDADEVAAALADVLDPAVAGVEPHDEPLRWGSVADLVTVIALARGRAHGLDPDETWARAAAVVAGLRARRPHPDATPERLRVTGPDGAPLTLTRRSTCCQWYRAARQPADATGAGPSVTDARCADCPSLEAATNIARLAALAASGGLANP